MFPTGGSSVSLSLSPTPPYSLFRDASFVNDINQRYKWLELYKVMFDSKFYHLKLLGSSKPTGRSLVLEARAHLGFIGAYNKNLPTGPFERFFMGGQDWPVALIPLCIGTGNCWIARLSRQSGDTTALFPAEHTECNVYRGWNCL